MSDPPRSLKDRLVAEFIIRLPKPLRQRFEAQEAKKLPGLRSTPAPPKKRL